MRRRNLRNWNSGVMLGYSALAEPPRRRAPAATLRRGRAVAVQPWERALLMRGGAVVDTLAPGRYRRWSGGYTLRVVDTRPWIVTLPMQEIPTADGVTVKVTTAARARVEDPAVLVTGSQDADEALYLAIQIALREIVGTLLVSDLVTGRSDIGSRLLEAVRGLEELGLVLDSLELKDVVLPGDLKRAQAEVLIARAEGLAALERARGETAALRSLANAARLVADTPALLQLRLLQQLAATSGHTVVIGGTAGFPPVA
jgi:regulator of protease activity HflC (stomatin/prohibitin superfamily)